MVDILEEKDDSTQRGGNSHRKSLIEELPKIVERGKKEAQRLLDGLSKSQRITLQTNELVLPTKAIGGLTKFTGQTVKAVDNNEFLNRLIYGDNLLAMQSLIAGDPDTGLPSMRGKIDLIYIDPPFDSKADYRTKIHLPSIDIEQKPSVIEQFAYSDTWKDGTKSYLEMIVPRLFLMRELLSHKGSIYLHIDWHVGHYVKIIMDSIFGKENFRNEIIWQRTRAQHSDSKSFGKIHDVILLYSKSQSFIFNTQFREHKEEYLRRFSREDENGRKYMLIPAHAAGSGPPRFFFSKQINPPSGRHWAYTQEKIDQMIQQGRIELTSNGTPSVRSYLDENKGAVVQSIWTDITPLNPVANERLNIQTQKPEALLQRIIESSSEPNSTILDIFSGRGQLVLLPKS